MASLKAMKAGPYEDIARSDAVRQVMIMRAMRKKDDDIKEKAEESAGKDVEIQLLQQELEHEQVFIVDNYCCHCMYMLHQLLQYSYV